jgi:DNA ligase-1
MQAALLTSEIPDDVTGWWVSEKYDGIRAIWTGERLLTRHGKELKAPAWFTEGLPKNLRLDGELWMGRGTFDQLVSTIQKKGSDWAGVKFMIFDLADAGTFEERECVLRKAWLPRHAVCVEHRQLGKSPELYHSANDELDAMEAHVVMGGGEGCVIRRPGSKYRPGRKGDVIKVKRISQDLDRWQG